MALAQNSVSDLKTTPGIGHVGLSWTETDPHVAGLLNHAIDQTEVWASQTNDRTTTTKVAEGRTATMHPALTEGQTWHYWIRARARGRAKNGNAVYSDWHPSSATAGVRTTVGFAASSVYSLINGYVAATVGANALTIAIKNLAGEDPSALNPVMCAFPNVSVASGVPVIQRLTSSLSLTISNGSTLQTTNNGAFRLRAALFDDAGTLRLAVNRSSLSDGKIYSMPDSGIGSSVAEGGAGAADSVNVFYTGVVVTSKPYRTIAVLDWSTGLPTAGAWSVGPSKVRPAIAGAMIPGSVVQEQSLVDTTVLDVAAYIPTDNTIPQITEGTAYFTATMKPDSAANIFDFEAVIEVRTDFDCDAVIALFRDSTTNAIAATRVSMNIGETYKLVFRYRTNAADEAVRSYQVRVGPSDAAAIMTINRDNLGAIVPSYVAIRELAG